MLRKHPLWMPKINVVVMQWQGSKGKCKTPGKNTLLHDSSMEKDLYSMDRQNGVRSSIDWLFSLTQCNRHPGFLGKLTFGL